MYDFQKALYEFDIEIIHVWISPSRTYLQMSKSKHFRQFCPLSPSLPCHGAAVAAFAAAAAEVATAAPFTTAAVAGCYFMLGPSELPGCPFNDFKRLADNGPTGPESAQLNKQAATHLLPQTPHSVPQCVPRGKSFMNFST